MQSWKIKYDTLSANDQKVADELFAAIVNAMSSGEGALVMLTDPLGDGKADFYYGGNVLLVEPLLKAGKMISDTYLSCDTTVVQ